MIRQPLCRRYKHRTVLKEKSDYEALEPAGNLYYVKQGNTVDDTTYTAFYNKHLKYINDVTRKYADIAGSRADFRQLATIALWNALAQGMTDRPKVRKMIMRSVSIANANDIRQSKLGMSRKVNNRYLSAVRRYRKQHHREPTERELADFMATKIDHVRKWASTKNFEFIDHQEWSSSLYDATAKRKQYYSDFLRRKEQIEDMLIYYCDRTWLKRAIKSLTPNQQQLIRAMMTGSTAADWARRTGTTAGNVCTTQQRAMAQLSILAEFRDNYSDQIADPRERLRRKGIAV